MPITAADVKRMRETVEEKKARGETVRTPKISTIRDEMDPVLFARRTGTGSARTTSAGGGAEPDDLSAYQRALEDEHTVSRFLERNAPGVMDFLFPSDENERRWDDYNAWLEEDDNRERIKAVESVRHARETGGTYSLEDAAKNSGGKWTAAQLEEAEKKLEEYEQLPGWYRLLHRPDSSATGIAQEAIGGGASFAAAGAQSVADAITGRTTRADQMEGATGALMDMGLGLYEEGGKNLQKARTGLTDGQELAYNLAENTAENVLPLLLGAPWLLTAEQVARSAGAGVSDMAGQGRDVGAAALSGLGHGAISYAVERLGMGQMARNMGMNTSMGRTVDSMLDAIAKAPGLNRLPGGIAGILSSAGEEGAEEFVQTYLDTALDKVLGNDTPGLLSGELLGEAVQSAGMGALGGLAIGGVSSGIGAVQRARQNAYQRAQQAAAQQEALAPAALNPEAPTQGQAQQQIEAQAPAAPTEQQAAAQQETQARQTQTPASADLSKRLDAVQAAVAGTAQQEAQNPAAPEARQTADQTSPEADILPSAGQEERLEAADWERLAAQQAREVTEDPYWTAQQRQEARLLAENRSMSREAVELVVDAMPQGISGEVYTPAAAMVYQIARQGLADTEAGALELAGKYGAVVPQVMAVPGGAEALHAAWNQGKIEGIEASGYGRAGLAADETAGRVTYEQGASLPQEDRALLDLSAAASDTAVTVREKLENDAGGYVDTALGQIYFAAEEGQDTFGTILHEQTHLYNALDPEGGRVLQTSVLRALAESRGFEQVDGLIQSYVRRYQEAGQPVSYAQACEEVAADAWRGVFGSEEGFIRWARRQAAQAEQNAESRGTIRKMMDTVKGILDTVLQKAKQILAREPENTAARWAMELAESQKRALEQEYYRHQDAALEAQRAARQGGQAENRQTSGEAESGTEGRRAAQLREERTTAGERTAEERLTEESSRKRQLPVDDAPTESGQKMAAWENVDRAEVEKRLEEAYREKDANRIPVENIRKMAQRLLRETQSRENQITLAKRLQALGEYLSGGKADGRTALEMAEDIAEGLMRKSGKRDTGLWDQYPDLHYFTLYVKRGGTEYRELVYQYGDYKNAQKELARYGITLTTGEAHKDSAIDRVYQVLADDYGRFFPEEITGALEQVDRIAQVREMIRPTIQNAYGENWEEARADLGMQILGGMVREGVTDQTMAGMLTQRIDENLNRHRAGIQERVANSLGRIEREARAAARADAQRIVNQAAEGNRKRAEEWAKMDANQRTALARSRDALQRARDARSADATRRAIAANASKITRMLKNPSRNGYIPVSMMNDALTIAKIANTATYNHKAIEDLQKMETRFKEYLEGDGSESDISLDFKQSGIMEMLENLRTSMEMQQQRNARLEQQADDAARLFERGLNQMYDRQSEQEIMAEAAEGDQAGRLDRMSIAQLNTVRDLTSAILTTARNANRLMTIRKAQAASEIAYQAAEEVRNSPYKLEDKDGILKNFQKGAEFVNENVLNARRLFAVLSGYSHGGAMEAVSEALIAGEAKRNRIMVEGAKEFLNVMEGKENQKKYKKFSGTGAKLVTVDAFVDADGKPAQMTEAMADTLLLHLENAHNAENALLGGITIPDMKEYVKGNLKEAKRKGKLYRCKLELKSKEDYLAALPKAKASVEGALSDYAKTWAETSRGFLNGFTKDLINQTSMMMHGYKKATEENYVTLRVDPDVLEQKNEGVVRNNTIEGRGFLKNRNQYAINPILLEEIDQVVMRSLKDTADYAGLAPAIRDFNMVWNANRKEGGSLAATVGREFGDGAVKFVKEYLTDLQQPRQSDKNLVTVLGGALRTGLARGVLPLNVRVALGQISGVFGYGSELGVKGTAAAVEYMMTWHGKESDAAIRQEMMDWGYYGLESTLSDGPTTEIAERRSRKNTLERVSDKLGLGNVLELMDKKTREAGWIGCKIYVQENLEEYGLTEADVETQSDKYKAAVVSKMTRATENTQPNYTVSQLAAIQRSPDQMAKLFTMFKTQAFQNYGIAQYAIGDYRAQQLRLKAAEQQAADQSLSAEQLQQAEENLSKARKEATAAKQRLFMAAGGLASQGLVYSMIRRLIDFIFYKEDDDLRDEDGEITPGSVAMTIGFDTLKAATTDNVFLLPEAMAVLGNIVGIRNTEPVSLPGVDSLGDLSSSLLSFYSYWTDTAESAEKALSDAEIDSLWEALTDIKGTVSALKNGGISVSEAIDKTTDLAGNVFMMMGAPVSNVKRLVEGVLGWGQDIYKTISTEGVSLGDVINAPTSSSQYDDLYAAVFETGNPEDAADALAALEKLDKLDPPQKASDAKAGDAKILSEMLKREKEYGSLIGEAAAARVSGDSAAQEKAMRQLVDTLAGALGIDKNTSAGRRRLTTVINKVNDAISEEMKKQMGADEKTGATIYTPVLNALESGSGIAQAQKVLRRAGIGDDAIRSAVVSAYKEDYLYADEAGRKAIEAKLLKLKDADGEAYFTEKTLSDWATDWTLKGFNDSVYTDLDEALRGKNQLTAQQEIDRYMEAGKSAGSIRDRIAALFKGEYLKADTTGRQKLAQFLLRLRGTRGEKLVTVDTLTGWIKDEAKKKAGK